jgi:hypothetical protein
MQLTRFTHPMTRRRRSDCRQLIFPAHFEHADAAHIEEPSDRTAAPTIWPHLSMKVFPGGRRHDFPANNLNYEITDGLTGLITSVSGDTSTTAAAALTPFIASGTNPVTVASVAGQASFSSGVNASVAANVTGSIPSAE